MSRYLTIFNKETSVVGEIPDEDKAMEFPFPLDSFQKEGIYRIYKGENVFITAHTGSGKTVLALYAIAECFRLNKKVIYTSPTKSLSNQKYAEFVEKFGGSDKIGILTGDIKMNPDAPCLIMTTEILRNLLYRENIQNGNNNNIYNSTNNPSMISLSVNEIGAVIFDEVHYINDPERGKVWEEVFVLLPREITLVLLSATIDKPDEFGSWLGDLKEKPIHLIPTSHRVVPLRHYFWNIHDESMIPMLMEDGRFDNYDRIKRNYRKEDISRIMNSLIDKLGKDELLPVLFFTFSRKKCEKLCRSVQGIRLLDYNEEAEVRRIFHYYMHPYKDIYEMIPQYQEIYELMRRGIAYHHSGLIPILKEIVEIIFGKGLIRVLFATETFAVGVNMPTKTVVFSELEKFDNSGRRYLRTDEYLQMSGRAGRRGLDKVGTVILLPTMVLPDVNTLKNMMIGKSPSIISKFIPTYQFVLKTMYYKDGEMTDVFLGKTLRNMEDKKRVEILGVEVDTLKVIKEGLDEEWNVEKRVKLERYEVIQNKLNHRLIVVKGKDRRKLEDELKSLSISDNDIKRYEEYRRICEEYEKKSKEYEYYETILKVMTNKMKIILEEMDYIESNNMKSKGLTAMNIGEADEILMTEMIYSGELENMTKEEIITSLSIFVDEKDKESEEKYIQDLDVSMKVKNIYRRMKRYVEEITDLEVRNELNIHNDFYYEDCLTMDMIEPTWIWINGGSMAELYNKTEIYEGNFVRGMMRLNQLVETYIKICMEMGKLEMVEKMEGYNRLIIRDFTTVNSLYVR